MNKIFIKTSLIIGLAIMLSGCFEEQDLIFDEMTLVEIERAVTTAPATAFRANFPIIAVTRTAGTQNLQVNLVGRHLTQSAELNFSLDTELTEILGAYNATTTNTIAGVAGTHVDLKGGKFTIEPGSSTATLSFDVLNPGADAGKFALVVIKLDGNSSILPSERYRRIGFRINLN